MSKSSFLKVLATGMFLLLFSGIAYGQVVKGSISGFVEDVTGARVPGAAVKAVEVSTGSSASTVSAGDGAFRISLLAIGSYNLTITKEGFRSMELTGVGVTAAQDTGLGELKLEVGQTTTTVEVTAAPPLLNTTQAQITTAVTGSEITVFPGLNGNIGLDSMVMQLPGVVGTRDNNRANTNGAAFSVNGLRGRANDQQIDGANNNDNSVTGPGLFVGNTDFVQEYQVTTNNFGPEYGRNAGSVVNVITKSGSNTWHGDVFGTEANNKLNTLSNTQKAFEGLTKLPVLNDEFSGGSVGGPILKDKLFVFGGADDEIIPGSAVASTGSLTPTPAGLQTLEACYPNSTSLQALAKYGPFGVTGDHPAISGTPVTKTVTPTTASGAPLLTASGAPSCSFEASGVQRLQNTAYHQYDDFTRVDVNGAKDRFYGRFMWQKTTPVDAGTSASGYPYDVPSLGVQTGISWTRTISANMFNEARLNYGRLAVQFGGNPYGNTIPQMSNLANGLASVTVASGWAGFGPPNNLPQGRIVNTYQIQDNLSYIHGAHQFKLGTNLTYQRSPNVFLPNFNGTYAFSSISNYIANVPSSLSVTVGTPNLDFREKDSFFYFGDDYKLRPNLTINAGITYSYFGQPANLFNTLDTKNETGSAPLFNPALPLSVRTFPIIPAPKNAFGPSIGFAYNPSWWGGAGKTVIRGGYRLAYDPAYYNIYLNIATATPQVLAQTLRKPAVYNVPLPADPTGNAIRTEAASYLVLGVSDPRSFNQTNVTPDFRADHVNMWSFGIQRQLGTHAVLESRYAGNHAGGLFQSINGNPRVDNLLAAFPNAVTGVTPCPAANAVVPNAVGRVNCNLGVLRTRANTGVSDYNSWQTELRTTSLWHQLTMKTSYTWSKTTDNTSEIFSSLAGGNTYANSQNPLDYLHAEHGLSGQDLPKSWTLSFSEDIPAFRSQHGLVGHVLGGWVLAGTYLITSGQPYTPSSAFLSATAGVTWPDTAFNSGFFSYPDAAIRPFYGSPNAPVSQVGIYAGDACNYQTNIGVAADPSCGMPANTLLSWNTLNTLGTSTTASASSVKYIVNGPTAESIAGTPFGNVPRNSERDYQTNSANFSVYKFIKVTERVKVRFDTTFLNVFNHPNFGSVDAFLDDAGALQEGTGFGIPSLTSGGNRQIKFGLRVEF